jgi:hypothetical protein
VYPYKKWRPVGISASLVPGDDVRVLQLSPSGHWYVRNKVMTKPSASGAVKRGQGNEITLKYMTINHFTFRMDFKTTDALGKYDKIKTLTRNQPT